MTRLMTYVLVGLLIVSPSRAQAQKVEASFNVGYSASEGVSTDNRTILGQLFDSVAPESGFSFNFTLGYHLTDKFEGEFLFGRQSSRFVADGPVGKLPVSDLALYNYMGNFVYNFGAHDSRLRPYVFGGLGATNYSFGDLLLPLPPGITATGRIDSTTRFSSNWGGGVKYYFTPRIGAKVGFRWTPTHIKSTPGGVWCDPFYGCWQLTNSEFSNQFESAGGVTVRF